MFKLTDANDLEKAGRSLGSYFTKQAEELEKSHGFHKDMAAHHDALKAAHTDHAAHHKAVHDGLADTHDMKGHFAKGATHHTSMATHHDSISKAHHAHAETLKAEIDTLKALSTEWGGVAAPVRKAGAPLEVTSGSSIEAMINETTAHLTKRTLESLDNDPAVQDKIREMVLKGVAAALGDKVIPDAISRVTPTLPGLRAVPRAGQQAVPEKPNVPLEFEKLVSVEDENVR